MSDLEGMALVLAAHQRDPHSSGAVNTLSLEVYRKKKKKKTQTAGLLMS